MVRLELERTLEVRQRVFHGVAPEAPHPDPVANVRPLQLAPAARRELRQRGRPRLPDRLLVRTARAEVEGPRRREFERQAVVGVPLGVLDEARRRSEEHTSELLSRGHLVCRLLLVQIKAFSY